MRICCVFLAIALTFLTMSVTLAAEEGLIGHWSFNDGAGDIARDSSGNKNDGDLIRGPVWEKDGKYGSALRFAAAQRQKVEVPHSDSFKEITTEVTISAWVYVTGFPAWLAILAKGDIAYSMFISPAGAIRMHYDGNNVGGNSVDTAGGLVKTDEWTYLLGTYDGEKIQIYVNGVAELDRDANTAPIPIITNTLTIGGTAESRDWMEGLIDEVRLYNRALTEDEVQESMKDPNVAIEPAGKIAVAWGEIKRAI